MTDPLMCTACFGPIHGYPVYVNGLPYHSQGSASKQGYSRSSLCSPPPAPAKDPKPIPGQLDLSGKVVGE